jgi:hypothetical protein
MTFVFRLLVRRIELSRADGRPSRDLAMVLGAGLELRRRMLAYAHGGRRSIVPSRRERERWARAAGAACEEVVARSGEAVPAIAWRAPSS